MSHLVQRIGREPRWIIAALWPLILLTPFIPALPTPSIGSLSWRQESLLAFLLSTTLALLVVKAREGGKPVSRREWLTTMSLALFVAWSAASLLWAASRFSAFHYALTWSGYLLFFLLIRHVAGRPRLLRASLVMLAAVVSIVSLASVICFWSSGEPLLRDAWGVG